MWGLGTSAVGPCRRTASPEMIASVPGQGAEHFNNAIVQDSNKTMRVLGSWRKLGSGLLKLGGSNWVQRYRRLVRSRMQTWTTGVDIRNQCCIDLTMILWIMKSIMPVYSCGSTYLSTCLPTHLPTYLPTDLSIQGSLFVLAYPSTSSWNIICMRMYIKDYFNRNLGT